jgi:cell division septation protein DedD
MIKIQAGYFSGKENAEKLLQKLQAKKIGAFIKEM